MRKAFIWLLLVSPAALGAALLVVPPAPLHAGGAPLLQKWEYHCILPPGAATAAPPQQPTEHEQHFHSGHGAHPSELLLNHLGDKGWELVAIDPNNNHYCFKRPKA